MFKFIYILIVFTSVFMNSSNKIGYDFSKPTLNITLPSSLQEISGTVILDSNTIACIQDENGILFLYDMQHYRIRKEIAFGLNGDYEGIAKVNHTLYVLRSDGVIFEIENYLDKKLKVKEYKTGITAVNNEGICYDEANNRLLIGEKGKINNEKQFANQRFIYEFDLKTKTLNQKALFNININSINLFAKTNHMVLPLQKNKSGKINGYGFKFNTSELAIHPITKELYVLSAKDHSIFIFTLNGKLLHIEKLNPTLFNKPESLSFYANGNLLISNEGQSHQPSLLQFNYHSNN